MGMRHDYGLAAFGLIGFASTPAAADAPDSIVVTAARTGDFLESFGGTIVDQRTIELLQPVSTLDVLDRLPGVRAFEKGGAGGPSFLSVRGGEPNFTLVLLDGLRVNDPLNSRGGAFDFAQIDPLALERIEIARGALSAVHGADALSGVVSLRMRTLNEGERLIAGRATADTRGGIGGSSTFGAGWSDGSLIASGGYFDSGDLTSGSDLERWQLFGRAAQKIHGLQLSAFALHARTDRAGFPEDSGGPRLAVIRDRELRETRLTATGINIVRAKDSVWRPRVSLGWVRQDDDATTPPIAPGAVIDGVPGIVADSRFERFEATFENRLAAHPRAELAFGATYLREDGEATGSIDIGFPLPADFSIARDIIGGFAEATLRPARWALVTAGLRYDDPSSARAEWTGRTALRLEPVEHAPALIMSWSEGYKLPSLFALAYPLIANPDLKPERSDTYEAGLEQLWAQGRGRARIAYFHARYTDLIDFDPEAFTNVNRARVTAQGVEAEIGAPVSNRFRASANLTYLDTDQPDGAAPLRSRPEWQGHVALDWRADERLELFVSAAYTSAFFDSSVPTGLVRLQDRLELTATAAYRWSKAVTLTVTGRNLLGDAYEDAVGFPNSGRLVRASVAFRL